MMETQPMSKQHDTYDAIVIGAGQSGGPLATALAQSDRRTALIERAYVGGTCINYGCTPTKTMVASARVAYLARRAADYGVNTGSVSINMETVRRRKRQIVENFRSSGRRRIEDTDGVDLIFGEAAFVSSTEVVVRLNSGGTRHLAAPLILINTGSSARIPKLEGLEHVNYLTNISIMELDTVPDHLIVLGGGYIGVEFAQMFRRFGSQVTVVQRGRQLLSREDSDVAAAVEEILSEDGIQILLESEATKVHRDGAGIHLTVEGSNGTDMVTGSHLLIAAGRVPNTAALNLAAASVETDQRGYIQVNERLETNVPGIYAIGDVKGGPAFTHISYDDFRILRRNLIEGGHATTEGRMVPYCIFMDPELARVGMSESDAREAGHSVRVARMPMSHVARALETDESRGLMKAIVESGSDQILGFTMLGLWAGEIMSLVQTAMMGSLPYTALQNAIFAHPTLAESLNNLFNSWVDAPQ